MQGPKKGQPMYVGIFACDPKNAAKTVQQQCRNALLEILKHLKPESYLQEGEDLPKVEEQHELQKQLNEEQITVIQKDYATFQQFSPPKDNYHITSLFIGKNKDKLKKDEKQILLNWKNGLKETIKVDFIAYVPGHLMAGSTADCGKIEVANKCPHMTLLLKEKAKAVQSNDVLEMIFDRAPELFKKQNKKVLILNIPYGKVSQHIIMVNNSFSFEGIAGDNISCGKK